MGKKILVINDSQEILKLFKDILENEAGHDVIMHASLDPQLVDKLKEIKPDLIISDHVFADEKRGWEVVQKIRMDREFAHTPVIVCSAAVKELRELEGLLAQKSVGVLYKPFDIDELLKLVSNMLDGGTNPVPAVDDQGADGQSSPSFREAGDGVGATNSSYK